MKKTLVFLGLMSIGFTYAQDGKVGINTNGNATDTSDPKATLDIRVAKVNETGDTNEGILIPKLSKERVVSIASGKRVEGTLVYVTDDVLSGDSANFTGTGKGFYFYNGSKWEKMGSGATGGGASTFENVGYGDDGKQEVINDTEEQIVIKPGTWFVVVKGTATKIKMPDAKQYSAGRTLTVFKETVANCTVLDKDAKPASDSTSQMKGNAVVISARGRIFVSDSKAWYPISY